MDTLRIIKLYLLILLMLTLSMTVSAVAYADSDEGVTVYFTVSDNGDFVQGYDGTVLASTPITIEYFDLGDYGLERFTYEDAGEQPTLLHLLIRATEKYYLGQKMTSEDFKFPEKTMQITYDPGSLYLKYFWGHDENLMYHVNDKYPEVTSGWGATCDRIVLEDGDTIDLAMFANWGISSTGAFAFFENKQYDVNVGEDIILEGKSNGGILSGTDIQKTVMNNTELRVSRDDGYTWSKAAAITNKEGWAAFSFNEPGRYLVSAGPEYPEYEQEIDVDYRCVAPPIAVINVTGEAFPPLSVSFDTAGGSIVSSQDVIKYDMCKRPEDPTRSGYTFKGWYKDQDLTLEYDFERAVKSNVTLYAGWEETPEHAEERAKKEHEAAVRQTAIKKAKVAKTTVSVKALTKHRAKVTWKKVTLSYTVDGKKYTQAVSGYKIYRAAKKDGKYKLVKTIKKAGTLKYTDKKLKKGKKYFYKVRTYTKINGKNYNGKWSKVRKIRVK